MAGMGPAPKHPDHRARRNATVNMTMLPAEGRPGNAPAWPLAPDISLQVAITMAEAAQDEALHVIDCSENKRDIAAAKKRLTRAESALVQAKEMKKAANKSELLLWRSLWKTPMATQWEKSGWTREVAQYVRHKVKAESGSLDDAKEARMMADRLGLNELARLRLRWEIAEPASKAKKPAPARSRRRTGKYGDLKVLDGGVA